MKRIVNTGARRLGIPGRPALILGPKESVEVSYAQLAEFEKNRTTMRWLETGVLKIVETDDDVPVERVKKIVTKRPKTTFRQDERENVVLPEGVAPEGVAIHHIGGGWYQVFVNGFQVTDRNVRKDEADEIASEYES